VPKDIRDWPINLEMIIGGDLETFYERYSFEERKSLDYFRAADYIKKSLRNGYSSIIHDLFYTCNYITRDYIEHVLDLRRTYSRYYYLSMEDFLYFFFFKRAPIIHYFIY
jgi:hypothetical protein